MNTKVMFFGATADIVGLRELNLSIPESTTASLILEQLLIEHPALLGHKLLIAVNEEYVSPDYVLNEGDVAAVFTAVSGG
jgi:molybdopterin converting factor small subunit